MQSSRLKWIYFALDATLILVCLGIVKTVSTFVVAFNYSGEHSGQIMELAISSSIKGALQFWAIPTQLKVHPMPAILLLLMLCSLSVRLCGTKWISVFIVSIISYVILIGVTLSSFGSANSSAAVSAGIGFAIMLALSLAVAFASETLKKSLATQQDTGRNSSSRTSNRGFTLLEVLAAIAIIGVLMAIIFPVIANSKDRAKVAQEMAQVRNLYIAVGLYEADAEEKSPSSLVGLVSSYAPEFLLSCPEDHRKGLSVADWPANPWILWSPQDDSLMSRKRSRNRVSYFFMRSWERAFPAGRTYEELRNDPEVGFIAGFGLFKCTNGTCIYPPSTSPYNIGHPASNIGGVMVEARTDGSIVTRRRDGPCESGMLFSQVFLFQDMNCRRVGSLR